MIGSVQMEKGDEVEMKENNADWCEKNCPYFPDCGGGICNFALALLKTQPDVVRCKDCKYWHDPLRCQMDSEGLNTTEDWFCADGERRKVKWDEGD